MGRPIPAHISTAAAESRPLSRAVGSTRGWVEEGPQFWVKSGMGMGDNLAQKILRNRWRSNMAAVRDFVSYRPDDPEPVQPQHPALRGLRVCAAVIVLTALSLLVGASLFAKPHWSTHSLPAPSGAALSGQPTAGPSHC